MKETEPKKREREPGTQRERKREPLPTVKFPQLLAIIALHNKLI